MTNNTLKVVNEYREPQKNEFFFNGEPRRTAGLKELLEYLATEHNFVIEDIQHWKIQSVVKGDYISNNTHGIRVVRK